MQLLEALHIANGPNLPGQLLGRVRIKAQGQHFEEKFKAQGQHFEEKFSPPAQCPFP